MSAYEIARDMSVGLLGHVGVTDYKELPWKLLAHILPASKSTAALPPHETPYVWARDFLEESGFNLTERVPAILGVYQIPGATYRTDFNAKRVISAVRPYIAHELSLYWVFTLIANFYELVVNSMGQLDMLDLAWLLGLLFIAATIYLWRSHVILVLSRVWAEMKEDVATFVQRGFHPDSDELPPNTVAIPVTDLNTLKTSAKTLITEVELLKTSTTAMQTDKEILQTSANAQQKRINLLRMSRFNFVRGRTGIIFNLDTSRRLQIQLKEAQEALKDEEAGHRETKDVLDRQNNACANVEEELEKLRANLETEESEEENSQLEIIEGAEEESPAADEAISQSNPEEADSPNNEQPEAQSLPEQANAQADPAAEDVNHADNAALERLQTQLSVEQANYRFIFTKKEIFRQGGKKLKEELEKLQAQYNELEDSRDALRETCETMEKQADVQAFQALRDQAASDNTHNERRIQALETELGFERTRRVEAEDTARQLQERLDQLDNMHGAEEMAQEEKAQEIADLKAECDRLAAELEESDERYDGLNAARNENAETADADVEDSGRANETAIFFRRPQEQKIGAPLRRVQSAPLWLPLPHHGDNFDPMYDVSDYGVYDRDGRKDRDDEDHGDKDRTNKDGDNDREDRDGDDDRTDDQGHDDDKHGSGNENDRDDNNGEQDRGEDQGLQGGKHDSGYGDDDGPGEDDKNDDDDPDDGRNGGADKVAADADPAEEDHVANPPGLAEDTTLPELALNHEQRLADLPVPESSPRQTSFSMNGSASEFVPSVRPKRPVPPILPHHQAYIASQQGSSSSDSDPGPVSPLPEFQSSLQGSVYNQPPFPEMHNSAVSQHHEHPEHTPAPEASGSEKAKNAHVQKLNEEFKRLEWRRKSGMPDLIEDKEGVPIPDDVLGKDSTLAFLEPV